MKVAIAYLGPFLEGDNLPAAARRVRDIARGLAVQGHEVSVLLVRRDPAQSDIEVDGIRLRFIGGSSNLIMRRLRYWKELIALSRGNGFDWVLFYVIRVDAYLVMRGLKALGTRIATIISDKHSANFRLWHVKSWAWGPSVFLGEIFQPRVSDLNICISQTLLDFCKAKAPSVPSILLPVLVDTDRFSPSAERREHANRKWGLSCDDIIVAYMGGLWKHHGVRNLMVAFSQFTKDYPHARLIIAGEVVSAQTHDDVIAIAKDLDLEEKIILTGWVGTGDVVDLYNRADILTLPQLDSNATRNGLPTKIAEYAAMGKAIVATQTSDIEVYFSDQRNAILVAPGHVEALSEAIVQLIDDPSLRQRIGTAAAQTAGQVFDYRFACKPISDYFESDTALEEQK